MTPQTCGIGAGGRCLPPRGSVARARLAWLLLLGAPGGISGSGPQQEAGAAQRSAGTVPSSPRWLSGDGIAVGGAAGDIADGARTAEFAVNVPDMVLANPLSAAPADQEGGNLSYQASSAAVTTGAAPPLLLRSPLGHLRQSVPENVSIADAGMLVFHPRNALPLSVQQEGVLRNAAAESDDAEWRHSTGMLIVGIAGLLGAVAMPILGLIAVIQGMQTQQACMRQRLQQQQREQVLDGHLDGEGLEPVELRVVSRDLVQPSPTSCCFAEGGNQETMTATGNAVIAYAPVPLEDGS